MPRLSFLRCVPLNLSHCSSLIFSNGALSVRRDSSKMKLVQIFFASELIIFKKIFFSHFEILERSKETVKSLYIRNLLYRNLFVQQSPINYLLQLHCLLIRMMI